MKIFAIMLVKNEIDIVEYVLRAAEKWADKIFILDNGSTDGTWELIQSIKNDVITPWKQYFGEYHNGLRADVYNEFKHLSQPGDWWCFKLDADEFFLEDPREFLSKVSKNVHMIGKQSLDYILTKKDIENYHFTDDFAKDREHIKYFTIPCYSEGRFFRYRKGLTWSNEPKSHYPAHVGIYSKKTILTQHYQYRSPNQIQKRIDTRHQTEAYKTGRSWGDTPDSWEAYIYNNENPKLVFDDGNIKTLKKLPISFGNYKHSFIKDFIKLILIKLNLYK